MNQALSLPSVSKSRRQRGSTLLEVLVSVLIFSFGILGLVAMQVRATQYSVDAEDRNRAALLADDLAAQMRLARTVTLPTAQLTAWRNRLADPTAQGLLNGTADINVNGNTAVITITWQQPRSPLNPSRLVSEVVLTTEEVT
ncbi:MULTISPECIES: type IV pilus modification protein PilV [unclassified Methylibium]|uniref:type IV pilus modification protein PilV n=1 Tax=unclassified Methylibium TaxID=2633235 RepID=UPI0003F43F92|nr:MULTISPECIES: type IV pilus modification protein PilV [unclassified Methylibium]EWS54271.1 type IV pilus modification protein PilV [Methylibium sp. T29]EWS59452.1 type IV pilus modification protein PilV [Methylibium sp. T29-B]